MRSQNSVANAVFLGIAAAGALLTTLTLDIQAAGAQQHPTQGLVWKVQGKWKNAQAGTEVLTGDAVLPGTLLEPLGEASAHSLTLLMPDGQRVLSECFTVDDCSRGFRVPLLAKQPQKFDMEMLDRMRSVISQRRLTAVGESGRTTPAQQDETVALLLPNRSADQSGPAQVKVQGLLASLPTGSYTYTLRNLDRTSFVRQALHLQKGSGAVFPIAGPGLYRISIFDPLNTERLDLLVAAIEPEQTEVVASFTQAKMVLAGWNEQYYGWPIHDLLRAYLVALLPERLSR